MKRSRSQAIYKFLPGLWIDYQDRSDERFRGNSYSIFIENWNTEPIRGMYTSRIHDEISRQIEAFEKKGGNARAFTSHRDTAFFHFVEASRNEGIGQIHGKIDPLVFYCSSCGRVAEYQKKKNFVPPTSCRCGKGVMKQLQMSYSCECGFASGIRVPYWPRSMDGSVVDLFYRPRENAFKFMYSQGLNKAFVEMKMECDCGAHLLPKNASDSMHFLPALVKSVNLINENEGMFFEYGTEAKKIILGKWLGAVSEDLYNKILENPAKYEGDEGDDDGEYQRILKTLIEAGVPPEVAEGHARSHVAKKKSDTTSISSLAAKSAAVLPDMDDETLQCLASEFIEFQTVKNARNKISMDDAIRQAIRVEKILDGREVVELNKRLGISDAQLSFDIELINSAFGFTRRRGDPQASDNGKELRLNTFGRDRDGMRVFCSMLETEGILLEFDRNRVIEWLLANGVLDATNAPDDKDPISVKRWFLENVDLTAIDAFSEIDRKDQSLRITYYVYALLHTISHSLIRSAGVLSGLEKNSLAELLFPNVPAIFIYAQSSQGVPLGALSGMFEQNYKVFLERALLDSQTCIFDPICSDNKKGAACGGCIHLAEISCCHFNRDLDRLLLHGNPSDEATISKGFWG